MDKKVILAVAGSGKTSLIVNTISLEQRTLILTYTDNNVKNLRNKIIGRFSCVPSNVLLLSYFTFLHSFCYKPFLWRGYRTRGINWKVPPRWTLSVKRYKPEFYIDSHGRLYHNRISKLLETADALPLVIERIEKYFDSLYVDEIQDFAGHDYNFLESLVTAEVDALFVGDFYQHTFDTSRDGNVNSNLHTSYSTYKDRLRNTGLTVDEKTLSKSHRCSPTVCAFVSDGLGIQIQSHRDEATVVHLIDDKTEAQRVLSCNTTVKLFYQQHSKYGCYSRNWGDSKGEDEYNDVCVVLNKKTYKMLQQEKLHELAPQTRNKLYVACTRARNDLHLLPIQLVTQ